MTRGGKKAGNLAKNENEERKEREIERVVGRPRTREREFSQMFFLRTFFFKFVSYKTSEREERVDTDFKEKKKRFNKIQNAGFTNIQNVNKLQKASV